MPLDGIVHKVRAGASCAVFSQRPDLVHPFSEAIGFCSRLLAISPSTEETNYGGIPFPLCRICHRGLVFQLHDGRYSRQMTAAEIGRMMRFEAHKLNWIVRLFHVKQ